MLVPLYTDMHMNRDRLSIKMARLVTRPPTAQCTLPMYVGFLISEPKFVSCQRVAEVLNISHDSVNRFLQRESYTPLDLYNEVKPNIDPCGGVLSVDDSVLDKPYSHQISYVGHYYSGKHHAVVKGINLITLYYTDPHDRSFPVNYRIYDKSEGKTKNDYFLEMLHEVLSWGLSPSWVTGDSWYSCVKNLKTIKNHGLGFLFALESNRKVSEHKGKWASVRDLEIPDEGLLVWLKEYGHTKLFRTHLKDQMRHYVMDVPFSEDSTDESGKWMTVTQSVFSKLHAQHWQIEQYHRVIKQVCHIEHFQVRTASSVNTHIFAGICGYVALQRMKVTDLVKNCYQLSRDLFKTVIAQFVKEFAPSMESLLPKFTPSINA